MSKNSTCIRAGQLVSDPNVSGNVSQRAPKVVAVGGPSARRGDTLTHAHISPLPSVLPSTKTFNDASVKRWQDVARLGKLPQQDYRKPPKHFDSDAPVKTKKPVESGNLQIWVDGSLIKVSKPSGSCNHSGGGKRNIVLGFSRGSRRRVLQKMAMLIRSVLPLFVTLTYPSEYPLDYTQWKKHLDTWCKRLHRKYPTAGLIWRLEAQKRGAPHYHLLIFGVDLTSEVKSWIAQSWFEVVASGDIKHLAHGTDVEMVRSARGVRAYTGKYIAKVQAPIEVEGVDWSRVGRWWGVRYAENLPFSEVIGGQGLSYREAAVFMRFLRRYLKGQGVKVNGSMPGMSVYVNEPKRWMEVLDRLLDI